MRKNFAFIATAILLIMANWVHAALVGVSANITSNTTWTSNNTYLLQGKIFVKNNAILTIQPGTIIVGENATQGSLIITRGSQIIANGTAGSPIVFTSEQSPGSRSYGDWGGLIILGNAPLNSPGGTAIIEGGFTAPDGEYGGNNPTDNSGILRYVRIEFAGIAFQPNSEINGLTCGGVGSGTIIDYVMVSFCGDDSYEFFGGTVNAKHLIAYRGLDDDFDTDLGYNGLVQFAVGLRDPNAADVSGSHAFESDNDATGSTNSPLTSARFSNVTLCGPYPTTGGTANANYKAGARLRRNTNQKIYNSLVMGWNFGLWVDGTSCENNANNGALEWQNVLTSGVPNATTHTQNPGSSFNTTTWAATGSYNNLTYTNNSDIMLTDAFNLVNPNFLPMVNSPALNSAAFTNGNLSDPFFEVVNYCGAFGNSDWTKCWANFDCQNTDYENLYTNAGVGINNAPTVTISSPSPLQFCKSKLITSSTSPVIAYQWFNGATPLLNANAATYTATATGGYKLQVTNAAGCSRLSNNINLTRKPDPATPQVGASCLNNVTSLGVTIAFPAYQWKRNGFNISNSNTRTITPTLAGNYNVVVTGNNGCTSSSVAKTFPVSITPTQLTAAKCNKNYSATTGSLACVAVTGTNKVLYEFRNANNPTVVYATKVGNLTGFVLSNVSPALQVGQTYNVSVRTIIGRDTACFGASCPINITTARESNDLSLQLNAPMSVYPNRATNNANIEFELNADAMVKVEVVDQLGKVIMLNADQMHNAGNSLINITTSELPNGIYTIKMYINGELNSTNLLSIVK
ncbi:MAG: T9SS type A sorting domain-containing protein [Bacteroidetes bacterium]|nr:T9SS type A sorting domain-containing protein [Bacteroidota bacterium]